ncbi:hypothetical protein [Streptomyces sp. NPDC029674]|uniref:hypothetical protein n=1 Tax=Streptomyces sp. NPDC029674 TaxID=3365297 RepID=UPI0038516BDA
MPTTRSHPGHGQLLLLVALLFGIVTMHTLGHPSGDPGGGPHGGGGHVADAGASAVSTGHVVGGPGSPALRMAAESRAAAGDMTGGPRPNADPDPAGGELRAAADHVSGLPGPRVLRLADEPRTAAGHAAREARQAAGRVGGQSSSRVLRMADEPRTADGHAAREARQAAGHVSGQSGSRVPRTADEPPTTAGHAAREARQAAGQEVGGTGSRAVLVAAEPRPDAVAHQGLMNPGRHGDRGVDESAGGAAPMAGSGSGPHGGGMAMDPLSVCLAVLGAFTLLALVRAGLLRLGPGIVHPHVPGRLLHTLRPNPPPPRILLSRLSVLRI